MGCEELIESLRKEAEEKVREIWREAEEEAGLIRANVSGRLDAMGRERPDRKSSEEEVRDILLEAENKARGIRLEAEDKLSARLYCLALSSLGFLREEGYEEIFGKLVSELPSYEWRRVRANPLDFSLAKKYFPEAEITADKDITGGVAVEGREGDVRVINTFEKRLERSWLQMLPDLLGDIRRELMDNGNPPES